MSFKAVARCPFLSQVSTSFLGHAGQSLNMYGQRCPVVSRLFTNLASSGSGGQAATNARAPKTLSLERFYHTSHSHLPHSSTTSTITKCPFRAALQSKSIHTAAATATSSPPQTREKTPHPSPPPPPSQDAQETTSDQCKCVADGLRPKGNCPFRWSKFVTDTVKEKVKNTLLPQPQLSTTVPVTTAGKLNYETFFENKVEAKRRDNSYRKFRVLARKAQQFPEAHHYPDPNIPMEEGKDVTVWCSNDYMGMSKHPEVVKATIDAVKAHGVGAGGTRNISGTTYHHVQLEKELAKLHQKESALVFSSCYVANDASLTTLGKLLPQCVYFSDEGNHNSMITGMRHSKARKEVFRHNDHHHLEELLQKYDKNQPKIVAFESVYSMSGSISPIEKICEVAHKYNALTFIDEVHAVGLYGEHGAGVGEREGLSDQLDIVTGTLGKAFGVFGGYIAGSAHMVDMVRSYADGFVFTTALPPLITVAARKSIQILASDEGRSLRQKHQESVKSLRKRLTEANLPVLHNTSHIIPLHVGDAKRCTAASMLLMEKHKIYVQDINSPTVTKGSEKLRIAPTPFHTPAMQEELVEAVVDVWNELGLEFTGKSRLCSYEFGAAKEIHGIAVDDGSTVGVNLAA